VTGAAAADPNGADTVLTGAGTGTGKGEGAADPAGVPVVGMVGGGQLARMTHQAAISLGTRLRVLSDSAHAAAARACPDVAIGDHRSLDDLLAFATGCDVLTFDHEHVPGAHIERLEASGVACRPGAAALVHAQDKLVMRERLTASGLPCPRHAPVPGGVPPAAVEAAVEEIAAEYGWPLVLKAVRGGYDGRGVWIIESLDRAARDLLARLAGAGTALLAEEYIHFRRELAVLVARSPYGQGAAYPVVETVQRNGICHEVIAPAPGLAPGAVAAAQRLALDIAAELGVTGLLAVEMFETAALEDGQHSAAGGPAVPAGGSGSAGGTGSAGGSGSAGGLLVNELAMRPHNCGHWTIEGARTSQFEQHLRAVLDLPLGSPAATAPYTVMANVLGGAADPRVYDRYVHVMAHDPAIKVHMYGKQFRPGRKIGHVTALGDDVDEVRERARHAADHLGGAPGGTR
jgi:5-(carboxyamino)imidazole ribonucleotide synthase